APRAGLPAGGRRRPPRPRGRPDPPGRLRRHGIRAAGAATAGHARPAHRCLRGQRRVGDRHHPGRDGTRPPRPRRPVSRGLRQHPRICPVHPTTHHHHPAHPPHGPAIHPPPPPAHPRRNPRRHPHHPRHQPRHPPVHALPVS